MNAIHIEYYAAGCSDPGCTSLRGWLKIALLAAAFLAVSLFGLPKEAHGDTPQAPVHLHRAAD